MPARFRFTVSPYREVICSGRLRWPLDLRGAVRGRNLPVGDAVLYVEQRIRHFGGEGLVGDGEGAVIVGGGQHDRDVQLTFGHGGADDRERHVVVLGILGGHVGIVVVIHELHARVQLLGGDVRVELRHFGEGGQAVGAARGEGEGAVVVDVLLVLDNGAVVPLALNIHGGAAGEHFKVGVVRAGGHKAGGEVTLVAELLILGQGLNDGASLL